MPAGRPKGSKSETIWKDALRRAAMRHLEGKTGPKAIEAMADRVVSAVIAGDMAAAREFGNRIDGAPKQQIEATITDERMVVEAPGPAPDAIDWTTKHAPVH